MALRPPRRDAPVSYSRRRSPCSTTIMLPWPMSSAVTTSASGGACRGLASSSGSRHSTPSLGRRNPTGASSSTAPSNAHTSANTPGRGSCTLASGKASRLRKNDISHPSCSNSAFSSQPASHGKTGASSITPMAIGVSTSPTHGMASTLATGPINDQVEKKAIVNGVSSTVAAHWLRAPSRSAAHHCPTRPCCHHRVPESASPSSIPPPSGCCAHQTSASTAQNESQNPACATDHGSSATMAAAASSTGVTAF